MEVIFAECKANPGKVQLWFHDPCIYQHECLFCSTVTSVVDCVDASGFRNHYNFYRIEIKKNLGETFAECWDRAKVEVEKNLQKYVYILDESDIILLSAN
jgi:hypothetical protein